MTIKYVGITIIWIVLYCIGGAVLYHFNIKPQYWAMYGSAMAFAYVAVMMAVGLFEDEDIKQ
jgi:hypothetical protein